MDFSPPRSSEGTATKSKITGERREAAEVRLDLDPCAVGAEGGGKNGGLWAQSVGDKPNARGGMSADPSLGSDESLKISPRF